LLQFDGFITEDGNLHSCSQLCRAQVTNGYPSESRLSDVGVLELGKQFVQQHSALSVTFENRCLTCRNTFFYVRPNDSDAGRPGGSGKALPSSEQSSDRLVWVEKEPVMPEPVLENAGAQRQLFEVG